MPIVVPMETKHFAFAMTDGRTIQVTYRPVASISTNVTLNMGHRVDVASMLCAQIVPADSRANVQQDSLAIRRFNVMTSTNVRFQIDVVKARNASTKLDHLNVFVPKVRFPIQIQVYAAS